jgi:hypothetical protein
VDTIVCTPDDGFWYHLKHVEQFTDKINCVTLHLVGYILESVTVSELIVMKCFPSNFHFTKFDKFLTYGLVANIGSWMNMGSI